MSKVVVSDKIIRSFGHLFVALIPVSPKWINFNSSMDK